MDNNFEMKDTKHLQLKSLYGFAEQLGYWYNLLGGNFDNDEYVLRGIASDKNTISFKTMVMLHNQENYDNHGKEYERFGFSLYDWNKAKAAKIVQHVNLTVNKKKKTIHCHKHLVKFVKPYYEEMFLK